MYRCCECGYVFDEGEQGHYVEVHTEIDYNRNEYFSCCPICNGDYEEVEVCRNCDKAIDKDDCFGGYCVECLADKVNYENALKYLNCRNLLIDFMIGKIYETDAPSKPSDKLIDAMTENYNRLVANEKLLGKSEFIGAIKEYILEDDEAFGKLDFAKWVVDNR